MPHPTRLQAAASDLTTALEALAGALAHARVEEAEGCEPLIQRHAAAFREAALAAAATDDRLDTAAAQRMALALRSCRRLGASLEWLAGPHVTQTDAPRGYTPVGQPLPPGGEGVILTARG